MTIQDYYDQLEKHDWHYAMSDSHSVWRAGHDAESKLMLIGKESPEHQELFNAFSQHHFTGTPWGTTRVLKPERPPK